MIVKINKKFLKELAKIPVADRLDIEKFIFSELGKYENIQSAQKIQKLANYRTYYKARFGDYRVGFSYNNEILIVERVLHRKEIYRYFP